MLVFKPSTLPQGVQVYPKAQEDIGGNVEAGSDHCPQQSLLLPGSSGPALCLPAHVTGDYGE